MKKRIISLLLIAGVMCTTAVPAFAADADSARRQPYVDSENATLADAPSNNTMVIMPRTAQEKSYTIPGGKGSITSNAWRTTGNGTWSGNTLQWNYQVSAVYSGTYTVSKIRTTWQGSASMRNSASLTLGISNSGGSAGASSSWSYVSTVSKYWENSNGAKNSSYTSNMIATPGVDYRSGTIAIANEAKVTLSGDPKPYAINASA